MCSLINYIWLMKEPVSLKTCQQKLPKLKRKRMKKTTENFEDQQDNSKGVIHTSEECQKGKRREKAQS